jgi:hypothetical protein
LPDPAERLPGAADELAGCTAGPEPPCPAALLRPPPAAGWRASHAVRDASNCSTSTEAHLQLRLCFDAFDVDLDLA